MMDLTVLRDELVSDLATTGIRVAGDPKDAQVPCILVGPITEVRNIGLCAWECEVPVYLISKAPGDALAISWLAQNITAVMEAVDGDSIVATLGTTNVGQGDLPCYEITTTLIGKE